MRCLMKLFRCGGAPLLGPVCVCDDLCVICLGLCACVIIFMTQFSCVLLVPVCVYVCVCICVMCVYMCAHHREQNLPPSHEAVISQLYGS